VWGQSRFDLQFDRVPIYELVRLVYGDLLREPFVISGEVAGSQKVTSLDFRGASSEQVRLVLESALTGEGIKVDRVGVVNVVGLGFPRGKPLETFLYRPKFRTVAYLESAVRALVAGAGVQVDAVRGVGVAGGGPVSAVAAPLPGGVGTQAGPPPGGMGGIGSRGSPTIGGTSAQNLDVLLFRGSRENVDLVKSLVEGLDQPGVELSVKASVFEVQTTKADSSAVQIAYRLLGGSLVGSYGSVGGPIVHLLKGGFEVAVGQLASDSRFRLVSSPSLRVTSGEVAKVSVGQEVPVLGGLTVPAAGAPVQAVNYQGSGVMLTIEPVALSEVVRVKVVQELSSFALTTTGVNNSPTMLKRVISSVVSLRSGEVVFLGGLDELNKTEARGGMRWLPDFLRSRDRVDSGTELVVMLQVEVL